MAFGKERVLGTAVSHCPGWFSNSHEVGTLPFFYLRKLRPRKAEKCAKRPHKGRCCHYRRQKGGRVPNPITKFQRDEANATPSALGF